MISYRPLRDFLYFNNIKMVDLINDGIVTPNLSVKLNNDRGAVSLSTLYKIYKYLKSETNKDINIKDLVEFIPD